MQPDQILISAPGLDRPLTLRIEPQSALLVGRNPSESKLPPALRAELGNRPVRCESIASARVSANHVLVLHTGEALRLWDLASRNGSWVQLLADQQVELSGKLQLVLDLAPPRSEALLEQPKAAEWPTEHDFAGAVAQSVRDWLSAIALRAEVLLSQSPDHTDDCFGLADGSELRVLPLRNETLKFPWSSVLDTLRVYINEQNNAFELLQGHDDGFVLCSRPLRETHRQLAEAAARGMRVILLGPTGVGKERLASCYHRHSRQHRGPFATINCSLLSENLLYAQLFGARKGSFTGCVQDIIGVVEAAHEGTLFLDEIGEMSAEVQRSLLRFLDSRGEYQRLGDARTRHANVQIVCATNVDLDDPQRRAKLFREDLWYRLAVRVVRVPPLRERREDVIAYLQSRVLDGGVSAYDALSSAALQRVLDDPWPGNFRDLQNFVERLPAMAGVRSVDEAQCLAARQDGLSTDPELLRQPASGQQMVPTAEWVEIATQAAVAFAREHGPELKHWGQLSVFMEKYLKPVFLAQACGLSQLDEMNKNLNFSELARRLNIADGTTVKTQLQRYVKHFRPGSSAESRTSAPEPPNQR